MEADIAELVQIMDDILTFAESVDTLKTKLERFADTIQEVLVTVRMCCSSIRRYNETAGPGTYIIVLLVILRF